MSFIRPKIALIGGGKIGSLLAQMCSFRQLGDIVLFDINHDLTKGIALDIAEASRVEQFNVRVNSSDDYRIIEDADLCIVTAGFPRKPGMSREDLLAGNAEIIKTTGEKIKAYAPRSHVIVITNPLDAMTTLMQHITGFPKNRVFGQAGVLDSSRFATFISWELDVSVQDVNALVLGSHGDMMVPLVRYANVNCIPVMELLYTKYGCHEKAGQVMDDIVERTRKAGEEIVKLISNGSASFSPAASAYMMAKAIINDEKRVLSASALLEGEYGINGYYAGVPVVLGRNGVERVLEISLDEKEQEAFSASVDTVIRMKEDLRRLEYI